MRSGPGLQTAQLLSVLKPAFKVLPIMPTQKLTLLVTSKTRDRVTVSTLLTSSEKQMEHMPYSMGIYFMLGQSH